MRNRKNPAWKQVLNIMMDHRSRTVEELHQATGIKHTTLSAILRNLRKLRFGGYTIDRTSAPHGSEYRLII